mmetsp:Transcript_13877/g.30710  ORF Transcript_13877/g.30710 Transcript_13877/m.30710 type:complete len:204 (+) Transcript_13877:384-995(+)
MLASPQCLQRSHNLAKSLLISRRGRLRVVANKLVLRGLEHLPVDTLGEADSKSWTSSKLPLERRLQTHPLRIPVIWYTVVVFVRSSHLETCTVHCHGALVSPVLRVVRRPRSTICTASRARELAHRSEASGCGGIRHRGGQPALQPPLQRVVASFSLVPDFCFAFLQKYVNRLLGGERRCARTFRHSHLGTGSTPRAIQLGFL